jgi:hypothetical protein
VPDLRGIGGEAGGEIGHGGPHHVLRRG